MQRENSPQITGFGETICRIDDPHEGGSIPKPLLRFPEVADRSQEMIATIAHELRNSFFAIMNATSVLKQPHVDPTADRQARDLVERHVMHVARTLDNMVEFSRVTDGACSMQATPCDLVEMARELVESATPLVCEKRQRLIVDLPRHPLVVVVDQVRLRQAQLNLLVNAIRYTPSGGEIRYRLQADDRGVSMVFADNGRGLAGSEVDGIFEPFMRGTDDAGGLGIGLAVVRSVVLSHRGRIHVASQGRGLGSQFTLWIPIALARDRTVSEASSRSIQSWQTATERLESAGRQRST